MKTVGITIACLLSTGSISAFTINGKTTDIDRRAFVSGAAAALTGAVVSTTLAPIPAEAYNLGDPKSVVGREIQSFNGLIYNFKNTALSGGLDASKLKEPSVPFIEFGERMKNGEVALVEFYAPNGDVAYVTFKSKEGEKGVGQRIRIGQGYPTESKDSWSSPAYVIRSVSNFGVPYKFVVPGLEKYRS
uniref:Photosystem II reaction center Psb28 protein n=1 Tax=Pseudictyota dubia TaxID=2749911 RepID=A0A7R9VGV7_9STRA|mmetsp:Transcript_14149/g.26752  ORF Transcript_14149/g.26752 Transcript_14149/m.26752 type:complete len:189 (+) Transcript_14149:97-663(+)